MDMDMMDYDHDDHDDHDDHHHDEMEEQKAVKQDPWAGYYDFLINEGSFKFWAVFQVRDAALMAKRTVCKFWFSVGDRAAPHIFSICGRLLCKVQRYYGRLRLLRRLFWEIEFGTRHSQHALVRIKFSNVPKDI